jgi:hypothetical protein
MSEKGTVNQGYLEETGMLIDLFKQIDNFVFNYKVEPDMKNELLKLIQLAVEHGEAKDQNKISGILVKAAKAFWPGSK